MYRLTKDSLIITKGERIIRYLIDKEAQSILNWYNKNIPANNN